GTASATLDLDGATLAGVVGVEDVALGTPVGTFGERGIGSDIAVTTNLTLTGDDKDNYSLTQPTGLTADITAKALTVTGAVAEDKAYDGTASATLDLDGATLAGVVGVEDVALGTPVGTF